VSKISSPLLDGYVDRQQIYLNVPLVRGNFHRLAVEQCLMTRPRAYWTDKHSTVRDWLAKHPRFHMHFTPISSSWLNLVERLFRDLTDSIAAGSFVSVKDWLWGKDQAQPFLSPSFDNTGTGAAGDPRVDLALNPTHRHSASPNRDGETSVISWIGRVEFLI
jgi:hypothetical protein